MTILGLDTSGGSCSVAISVDGVVRDAHSVRNQLTHSQTLLPLIDAAVNYAGIRKEEIDIIAVSEGPGSFTGLRIGAALAKGLALAWEKDIIAVPTLPALACNMPLSDLIICPMMDARRGQVYAGTYAFDTKCDIPENRIAGAPMEVDELLEILNEGGDEGKSPVCFLGDGALAYREIITAQLQIPYRFAPMQRLHQDAANICLLAQAFLEGTKEEKARCTLLGIRRMDADLFAPVYLRPAQAEREHVYLRPMEAHDLQSALVLEKSCFSRPWTEAMLQQALADAKRRYLVAVVGERADGEPTATSRVIGLCGVENVAGEGIVTNVGVDIEFRRQGIAAALLEALLEEGRQMGIAAFTLEVRAGNTAARKLYESMGFVCEGIRPGFYEAPREDAAIYWLRDA